MTPKSLRLQLPAWLVALVLLATPVRARGESGRILLTNRPAKSRARHKRVRRSRSRRSGRILLGNRRSRRLRRRHLPGRPYAGIVPGTTEPPPGPKPPSGRCWLTWPGFQLTAGGSRVFFQLSQKVAQTIQSRKRGFDILFPGCKIRLKNNLHRLVTAYFPSTPVLEVRTRNTRKGVVARIRLRNAASPRIHWLQEKGWAYLLVDFGPYGAGRLKVRSRPAGHESGTTTKPAGKTH